MSQETDRAWTTLWDRQNRRVLLLAGQKKDGRHWYGLIEHDTTASLPGVYDIWRHEKDIVFVEIELDENDEPRGFPHDLLSENLLGSMTVWPCPDMPSFIWWHSPP